LSADAPIEKVLAGDALDFTFAVEGERQFARITLKDIDVQLERVGDVLARNAQEVLKPGGKEQIFLGAGRTFEVRFDDEARSAVLDAAVDGEIVEFEFGGGAGENGE
jgi:hypothetical protein